MADTNNIFRVSQTVQGDLYIFKFYWELWNPNDLLLLDKFGEPLVNVGGTFGTDGNAFTLADEFVKLKSGFPYTRTFNSADTPFNTAASVKAQSYREGVKDNVADAITALRAEADKDITGNYSYNISVT